MGRELDEEDRAPESRPSGARLAKPDSVGYPHGMIRLDSSPVSSHPAILGGTLVFRGTRVPVQSLLDYRQDGFTVEQFVNYFPTVKAEDAHAFLRLLENSRES